MFPLPIAMSVDLWFSSMCPDLEQNSEPGEGPSILWCWVMRVNQSLQLKKIQARQPPVVKHGINQLSPFAIDFLMEK